jgi:hypothetical protein
MQPTRGRFTGDGPRLLNHALAAEAASKLRPSFKQRGVKKAGTWLRDLTSALRALMAPIEQRGIDKSTTNRNLAGMMLATTSEAGAVDRHAVVHGFVLSVADIITSALRAGAVLVQAGFILSLEVSTPPHRRTAHGSSYNRRAQPMWGCCCFQVKGRSSPDVFPQ